MISHDVDASLAARHHGHDNRPRKASGDKTGTKFDKLFANLQKVTSRRRKKRKKSQV